MKYARLAICAVSLGAVLALSACGNNDHDNASTTPTTPTTPPVSVIDAFITTVMGFIAATGEDTEPKTTDGIVATTPETDEPVSL